MRKCLLISFTLILLASTNISFAQEEEELYYPSLIKAKYAHGKVSIVFEPVKYKDTKYKIYRSESSMIYKDNIIDAEPLSEITEDELPFEDAPNKTGKYYYAVTLIREGREYLNFIPFQNTLAKPIDFSPFPEPIERINIKKVTDLNIEIHYYPSLKNYTYKLFVASSKLTDVSNMHPTRTNKGDNGWFNLTVKRQVPYYFSITTVNRLGVENIKIISGKNSTIEPFIIKELKKVEKKKVKLNKPITNKELITKNLKNNFYNKKYKTTLKEFFSILRQRHLTSSEVALIHFYIGQCYFYLEDYKKAIRYFILSKETYMEKSEVWIDRALEMIE